MFELCCWFYMKELIADPFQLPTRSSPGYVNLTKSKGPRFTRECCSLDADTYAKAG